MWTFLILSLISSVLVSASCQSYEDSNSVSRDRPTISIQNAVPTTEDTEDIALLSHGEDLRVFCTGSQSSKLSITRTIEEDIEEYLKVTVVNETTVSWFVEKPPKMSGKYNCIDSGNPHTDTVNVVVDTTPELLNFQCKSSNFLLLNCSWSSLSVTPTFTLSSLKAGDATVLCKLQGRPEPSITPETAAKTYFCTWYLTNAAPRYEPREKTLTFQMQSCNAFSCRNDTFNIDHYSILELDSPRDLIVFNRSNHSVVLAWSVPYESWRYISKSGIDHKVDYIFQGNRTVVDTSFLPGSHLTYDLELKLPYAGRRYEARISIKPKTASDEFWSKFAYISFFTREEHGKAVNLEGKEPKLVLSSL